MIPFTTFCFSVSVLLQRGGTTVPSFTPVLSQGDGGFANIRIPSVVVAKGGAILAFAEGRDGRQSDQAKNKIVYKRSTDGGLAWSELRIIADDGSNSLNNPCAVVDRKTGRIYLMYQRIPSGLSEGSSSIADGYEGANIYRSFLTWSDDEGLTWMPSIDVTRSAKHATPVKTIASGPGIGIQLTRGKHKGRLIIPFNEGPFYRWNVYAVFSDDHGKSWQFGENAPGAFFTDEKGRSLSKVNEVQMAELSDGSIILNSRQFAGNKVRKAAVSKDGGVTWSDVYDVPELRDPSCMGSILRYSFGRGSEKGILLYSGPNSTKRDHGTIYASFDDGQTWPVKKLLVEGDFAYSVLARLPNGDIGCLFETNDYRRIDFARFDLGWLFSKGKQ